MRKSLVFGAALTVWVGGCAEQPQIKEQRSAQTFAATAFESLRAGHLRQLPLADTYDSDAKISQAEAVASLIPRDTPLSAKLTETSLSGPKLALVRTCYNYSNRAIVVSVGMERSSEVAPWKLYGLSVTPEH